MAAPVASPALERLMQAPEPYTRTPGKDADFLAALDAGVRHHRARNAYFAARCAAAGLESVSVEADVWRVPPIFVNVLKHHELLSIDRADVALHLTSSGTTGQKSQIFFDEGSLKRGLGSVETCFGANGVIDRATTADYVIFAHDPAHAPERGTSYTDHYMTGFTQKGELFYALKYDPALEDWRFDLEGTLDALERFAAGPNAVRVIGFPAFIHRVVAERARRGLPPLALGPDAWVLTGGGWKSAEDEKIEKPRFVAEVSAGLGVPAERIRDGYGLVEHGLPYLECDRHRFHAPHFARAAARDVTTLEVLPDGEAGFLNLVSPYLLSMPQLSLLTSDLAVVGRGCPCGRTTEWIEILGRAGTRAAKGCAIAASELLKSAR